MGSRRTSAKRVRASWLSAAAAVGLIACADDNGGDLTTDSGAIMTAPDAGTSGSGSDAGAGGNPSGDAMAAADTGAGAGSGDGLTVAIGTGQVKGKLVSTTREFLGIPFGKAPTGALRFAPPQPAEPWTETRDATNYGPSCAQNMGALSPMGMTSEDCLSVNVFTPQTVPAEGLPVYVFIHGGAFISGGSSQYDMQKLSERGPLVAVTLNYRLGVLGFLSLPELDAARGDAPSGNDALRDQQLALKWVQDNIAAFGGDPKRVTVAGESAGAMSACMHLVSPTANNLAARFVFESGVCFAGGLLGTKADADALGGMLKSELCAGQADVVKCLRDKPLQDLTAWGKDKGLFGPGFAPVVNAKDPLLPEQPKKLMEAGKYNKGAILAGTNKNEWGLFQLLGQTKPANVAEFEKAIDEQFAEKIGAAGTTAVKQHYKPASDAEANAALVRAVTDAAFRCPTRSLARTATAQGSKVYLYSFEQGDAFHAYEIPYVLGVPNPLLAPMLDEPTVMTMQGYWMEFATKGDPNGRVQPTWPVYDAASDPYVALSTATAARTGLAKDDCDFWDKLMAAAP